MLFVLEDEEEEKAAVGARNHPSSLVCFVRGPSSETLLTFFDAAVVGGGRGGATALPLPLVGLLAGLTGLSVFDVEEVEDEATAALLDDEATAGFK